jgi:hypothetical protein
MTLLRRFLILFVGLTGGAVAGAAVGLAAAFAFDIVPTSCQSVCDGLITAVFGLCVAGGLGLLGLLVLLELRPKRR